MKTIDNCGRFKFALFRFIFLKAQKDAFKNIQRISTQATDATAGQMVQKIHNRLEADEL